MKVKEWMNIDPIHVGPQQSVGEARRLMSENGFRHLLVVEEEKVIGILSDRDVRIDDKSLRRIEALERLGEAVGEQKPVEAVMSESVHHIGPEDSVGDAARTMLSRKISALPVVGDDMSLIGIITTTDCLLAALSEDPALANQPGVLSR